MTATQITPASTGPDLQAMLGPGQQGILDQFLAEQGAGSDAGQEVDAEGAEPTPPPAAAAPAKEPAVETPPAESNAPDPSSYTPEKGIKVYGETIAAALTAAEVNPFAMQQALEAGKDAEVDAMAAALSEKGGIPRPLIDTYLAGFKPAPAEESSATAELDPIKVQAIVGGLEKFTELGRWATATLPQDEINAFNDAVSSGNQAAAEMAVRFLAARRAATAEPTLVSGGAPAGDVFESQAEATAARWKRDGQGNVLYDTDPKYRRWMEATIMRSRY